ncbi:MAG: DNA polymerase III subunit alpha, partial [Sulfobacillus sp.]|nr:DNA polymerase III subunit alpha [Sulfobacillus sp.]
MNPWPRVPLIIQSGYSLLKSMIDVDRLAGELADRGFRQAVLADDHSWAGAEKFDDRLRRQGVSPWLGITRRIWVADGQRVVRLVAETREAWHWLIQADDVMQALPEGVWVIVAASQDSWWLTGADELGRWAGERVVVAQVQPRGFASPPAS